MNINFLRIIFILFFVLRINFVNADEKDEKFDWMNQKFSNLSSFFSCLESNNNSSIQEGKTNLNLEEPDIWISTGQYVMKDRAIRFDWSTLGATAINYRKYRVLYRIDPRFDIPQIFIKLYNDRTKKFEAIGYPYFNSTDLDKDYSVIAFGKMQDYINYIAFNNRPKIPINKGDVLNITLGDVEDFFTIETQDNLITQDLGKNIDKSNVAVSMLYTYSGIENKIIYTNINAFCKAMLDYGNSYLCNMNADFIDSRLSVVGMPFTAIEYNMLNNSISNCNDSSRGKDNTTLCYYDQGRGIKISVGNYVIKHEFQKFLSFNKKNSLYYKSDITGILDLSTDWLINDNFISGSQILMKGWIGRFSSLVNLNTWLSDKKINNFNIQNLHFGRYIMIIEVGNGDTQLTDLQQKDISVEYTIVPDSGNKPESKQSGIILNKDISFDAYQSGYLWLKVKNPNFEVKGNIEVKYSTYTGTTWFSDIIYTGAVKPITDQFYKITRDFYTKLTKNSSVQRIARLALVLYICVYGLTFLAGATQITAKDLVIRISKITIIVLLLSENSWEFFNNYLFSAYIHGTDYLMTNVVGLTGSKSNIFGFIDPIFDKYTQGRFWGLLFIQLLQLHNGLTFVAIITIYSLLIYFRAILEVIVTYIIAYVGLSVMISLAPFFLILMLFEQTKSIFENWLSTLFSYVIQPTILLIFFLLIDQLMYEQISKIVLRACWGILIPIKIGLDLTHLDIPINFSFSLPFLPGIPFFIPEVKEINNISDINNSGTFLVVFTSALLFYLFSKMAYGLVEYITTVSSMLTNVTPARQEGNFQKPTNPTSSIVSDITETGNKVLTPIKRVGRVFKDKVIDQNYTARKDSNDSDKEYTSKILASRNDSSDFKEK